MSVRHITFDPDDFVRQFDREPLLIRGIQDRWKARSTWSPKYIAKRFGDVRASVKRSTDGIFRVYASSSAHSEVMMSMAEYVKALEGPTPRERLYLQQTSIAMVFPELLADLELDPKLDRYLMRAGPQMNLWFGGAENISPLHFDLANNLFCQVVGNKRISLFPPDDFDNLYANPPGTTAPQHLSQVNIDAPDLERFPRFARARRIDITVGPGDTLYIPPFWWHQVYSLDISMSVNIWWGAEPERYLVPAMRVGPIREWIGMNPRFKRMEIVRMFVDGGYPEVASVLCALIVHDRLREVARRRGLRMAPDDVVPPGAFGESLVEQLVRSGVYNKVEKPRLLQWLSHADASRAQHSSVAAADVTATALEIERFFAR